MRHLRYVLSAAALLVGTGGAHAAWIECDEEGGRLVDMPAYAEAALVAVGDETVLVANPDADVKGSVSADEFCADFDGEVAFVLPIPRPGVAGVEPTEDMELPGQPLDDLGNPNTRERTYDVNRPDRPEPPQPGMPPMGEEEPAPLPADVGDFDRGPDSLGGCSAAGSTAT